MSACLLMTLVVACGGSAVVETVKPGSPTTANPSPTSTTEPTSGGNRMSFELSSSAFANGAAIPGEYTCDGADEQLPLAWSGAPTGTAEFALVMDDPDANGFVHWVVTGIPADATALGSELPNGAVAGRNGFGKNGYGGPCPPTGTHRYRIALYALSAPLGLGASATAAQVRAVASSQTLSTAMLTGTYARS